MAQIGLNFLNEDDQLELLKYLPIKERIRFERANKNWARLLDRQWLSQKQLQFGINFGRPQECHSIHFIDICVMEEDKEMPAELIMKVISKCKNLISLEVNVIEFQLYNLATKLASVINDNCKQLEHIGLLSGEFEINLVFFELLIPSENFTCLLPLHYDRLKKLKDKSKRVQLPIKILDNFMEDFDPRALDLVDNRTVTHLASNKWNSTFSDLFNLTNVCVYDGDLEQIGNFHQLEHILMDGSTTCSLRRVLVNNLKLTSLKLVWADEVIDTIVKFGFNLKMLELYLKKTTTIDDYQFWQKLSKLAKLRSIVIHAGIEVDGTKLNVNGITLLLKTCTKLKYMEFSCDSNGVDITTELEKEQIRKVVADKSFRQFVKVTFKCNEIAVEPGQCIHYHP